jgi:hypothetical protein
LGVLLHRRRDAGCNGGRVCSLQSFPAAIATRQKRTLPTPGLFLLAG